MPDQPGTVRSSEQERVVDPLSQDHQQVGQLVGIGAWLRPLLEAGAMDLNIAPIAGSSAEAITGLAEVRRLLVGRLPTGM